MLEKILMKLNKEFNLSDKMELVEHVESIMYDDDNLTIYETYESREKIIEVEAVVEKYLSRLENNEELEDFEENHLVDSIRSLVLSYESIFDEISVVKLFIKLFKYLNN